MIGQCWRTPCSRRIVKVLIVLVCGIIWNLVPLSNAQAEFKIIPDELFIDGNFGSSVALYGNYAIIGAEGYDEQKGCAYIFKWDGNEWKQQAKLVASDGQYKDKLGVSVTLTDDYAAVGTIYHVNESNGEGAVYVYQKSGNDWSGQLLESAKLISSDTATSDKFGMTIDAYEDTLIIGAQNKKVNDYSSAGMAYIFVKPQTGWSGHLNETAKISPPEAQRINFELYGSSVSISKDFAAVGAKGITTTYGAAYIFKRPVSGWVTTTQADKLVSSISGDMFGDAISISNDYLVVGAYSDDIEGKNRGAVYVYKRIGDAWGPNPLGNPVRAFDAADSDEFSRSALDISNNIFIAGAKSVDHGENSNAGAAYLFRIESDTWIECAKIDLFGREAKNDYFGTAVAISDNFALIGAPGVDTAEKLESGAAYIYNIAPIGDVDYNCILDLKDAIMSLKILAGLEPENIYLNAEPSHDGKIGLEDVIYILQKVAQIQ